MIEMITELRELKKYRGLLKNKTMIEIEYWNQSRSQAFNMRNFCLNVIIENNQDSYFETVEKDELKVLSIEKVSKLANIIFFLISSDIQPEIFKEKMEESLKDEGGLVMISEENYFYNYIESVLYINVLLIEWNIYNSYSKCKSFSVLTGVEYDHFEKSKNILLNLLLLISTFFKGVCAKEIIFTKRSFLDFMRVSYDKYSKFYAGFRGDLNG